MEEHNGLQGQTLPAGHPEQEFSRSAYQGRNAQDIEANTQDQSSRQGNSAIANGREAVEQDVPTSGIAHSENRSLSVMERRRLWTSLSLLWLPGSTLYYSYRRKVFVIISR